MRGTAKVAIGNPKADLDCSLEARHPVFPPAATGSDSGGSPREVFRHPVVDGLSRPWLSRCRGARTCDSAHGRKDLCARRAHREVARRSRVVAGRAAPLLFRRRGTGRSGSRLGKPHVMVSRAKLASLEGAAASEQDRDHRSRYGMAAYQWAPDSKHLLFDANGRLWMYDLRNGTGLEIGMSGQAAGDDQSFSPNGEIFVHSQSWACGSTPERSRLADQHRGPAPERRHAERRGRLGLPGGTRCPQQLFLVAGFKEPCLPADERKRSALLPGHGLDSDPCRRRDAALPAAWGSPTPMCASAWCRRKAAEWHGSGSRSSQGKITYRVLAGLIAKTFGPRL